MNRLHANVIRLLIAMQVGVLEHANENIGDPALAMPALEKRYKELGAALKALKKEFD